MNPSCDVCHKSPVLIEAFIECEAHCKDCWEAYLVSKPRDPEAERMAYPQDYDEPWDASA